MGDSTKKENERGGYLWTVVKRMHLFGSMSSQLELTELQCCLIWLGYLIATYMGRLVGGSRISLPNRDLAKI